MSRKYEYLYAISTGDHVHYVGSTGNIQLRFNVHLQSGKDEIQWLLKGGGAKMIILAMCDARWACKHERDTILHFKACGMCELNDNLPQISGRREHVTKTTEYLHIESGQRFASGLAARTALRIGAYAFNRLRDEKKIVVVSRKVEKRQCLQGV